MSAMATPTPTPTPEPALAPAPAPGLRPASAPPQQPGGFVRDTAVLTLGLVASQAISLAVLPVWSRLYGPAEFAAFGLFGAVVSVVSMALMLRYDTCIVVATSDAQARALLRLLLALALGGGLVLTVLAWGVPAPWLAAFGLGPLGGWLPLATGAGAAAAVLAAGQAMANRQRAYRRMSASRVLLALTAAGVGTALGLMQWRGGLLWAQFMATLVALLALRWNLAPAESAREAARAHADAPRYLWPSSMLDAVTQQIPLWLTALWFGDAAAGQFSLAWRVAALPVLMLAGAAGSVFYQRFAAAAREQPSDTAALKALLQRTWRPFAWMGLGATLLLATLGGPLFAWIFGARWAEAGLLAAVMMPMLGAMLVSSPTSGALIVLGLQKWAPVFGVAMLLYRPAAFAIGAAVGSLPLALALWAACEVVAIALYNALLWRHLGRGSVRVG